MEINKPRVKDVDRVLVTGGAGFVGSLLVPKLLARGLRVRVLDNLMYGSMGLASHFIDPNFEIVKGDVTDDKTVLHCLKDVNAVVHLAAIVGYPACKKDPDLAKAVNLGAAKLLSELAPREMPIVFASTSSVYGENTNGHCTEDTPPNPLSLYGETKLQAEQCFLRRGNAVIFRYATAFGMSPRMRLDLLINDFVYQAIWKKFIVIYEKHYRRGFIHVRDMVDSLLFGLDNFDLMTGEIYNAGADELNLTKAEVAAKIGERVEFYVHYSEIGKDEDRRNYSLSYEKLESLGFKSRIGIADGLDELVRGISTLQIGPQFSNA